MRFFTAIFLLIPAILFSQTDTSFQIHAHRGFRGLYPENTITAFKNAAKLGAFAIELDIVISKDSQVVVSHEPWFNHKICSEPDGKPVKKFHQHNLYQLNYDSIKQYDCGKRGNKKFPQQIAVNEYKPLLVDVIKQMEDYCKENNLPPIHYNIEIKSRKIGDNKYHPTPETICKLLMPVLNKFDIEDRILIQSFDAISLQIIHHLKPNLKTGLLIANFKSVNRNIKKLGYMPYMYNPNIKLTKSKTINKAHQKGMKIIVWTVNKPLDIQRLKKNGC